MPTIQIKASEAAIEAIKEILLYSNNVQEVLADNHGLDSDEAENEAQTISITDL